MIKPSYLLIALLLVACGNAPAAKVSSPAQAASTSQPPAKTEQWSLLSSVKPLHLRDRLQRQVRVVAVTSKERPTGAYLVQIEGINDQVNGLVFLAEKAPYPFPFSKEGFAYWVSIRGVRRHLVVTTQSKGWGLWDEGSGLQLTGEAVSEEDAKALLALRTEQLRSGVLEVISPSTRDGIIAAQTKGMAEAATELASACGVSLSIDWASVKDEWFNEFDVGYGCAWHVEKLVKFCQDYPHVRKKIASLKDAVCHFEGDPDEVLGKISTEEGQLRIVPGQSSEGRHLAGTELTEALLALFGEKTQVLRSGERYFIIRYDDDGDKLYYGSKEEVRRQIAAGSFDNDIYPWTGEGRGALRRRMGTWQLRCGEMSKPLETVLGAERKAIIENAKFLAKPLWTREPYYLGRDSRGVYYYIDKVMDEYGGGQHRVFIGLRGQAKLSTLVGLVEDSQGMLFSTKKGNLRLIVGKNSRTQAAVWIKGKKSSPLTTVPILENQSLIYESLGAYFGVQFGDVCEE